MHALQPIVERLVYPLWAAVEGRARPYGLLADVEGRVVDRLLRKNGTSANGLSLLQLFAEDDGVRSFQVVQESPDLIRAKVVPFDHSRMPDLARIRERICAALGERVHVETEVCVAIPPAASGKHRFVVSKLTGS